MSKLKKLQTRKRKLRLFNNIVKNILIFVIIDFWNKFKICCEYENDWKISTNYIENEKFVQIFVKKILFLLNSKIVLFD